MAQTVISRGDALARKIYGVGVFVESIRRSTFRKKLTGPVPKQPAAMAKAKMRSMQTSSDMPIVQVTDLTKTMGDTVSIDLFGVLTGEPIMGDEKAAGTGQPLHTSSQDVSLNQYRKVADPGGRMTQKRTVHDLRQVCRANLADWFARCDDQLCQIHMAGTRGFETGPDWCIPLQSSNNFSKIVVNSVQAPTRNRRFLAGDATGVADLEITDVLSLTEIDRLRATLDEMELPPQAVKIPGDQASQDDPLFLLLVSSRQWHYLEVTQNARGHDWRTFIANAQSRARYSKHPLFLGAMNGMSGIWNGIMVIKTNRAIRFPAASSIMETGVTGAEAAATVAVATDRALLLGGQALGEVLGDAGAIGGFPMRWVEEVTDFENAIEIAGVAMGGKAKIRFTGSDGVVTDFGAVTYDSYAPDPNSADGATLRGTLGV